jgi:hypothetical protein
MNLCLHGAHGKQKQAAFPIFHISFENLNHWVGLYFLFLFFFFSLIALTFLFLLFQGTEFKNIACCTLGCILALEIQRGKEPMRASRHCARLGATAACTLRLMEEAQRGDARMGAGVRSDA